MSPEDQRAEFDKIIPRAQRAGLVKFCQDGVAVLVADLAAAPAPKPEIPADNALSSQG